jgi:hypothetical protein
VSNLRGRSKEWRLLGGSREAPTRSTPSSRLQRERLTTGGSRLSGVDVANDHDVDVELFFTRGGRRQLRTRLK